MILTAYLTEIESQMLDFYNSLSEKDRRYEAIEQQALLGLVTHLLMRLFLHKKGFELGLEEDHQTQQKRHEKKEIAYCIKWVGNYNRAFFKKLSKITKQAWRFLKNNFLKKSTQQLFE